jgi:hypothetical protein
LTRIEDNPRLNEFTFERALNYPYGRPSSSFLFGTRDGSHTPVDDPTVDLLKNRHAVLAIGSNASPEQLYRKYAHDLGVIPVISASLNDFDAVFAASITRYGSVPATLLESPGTTVDCHVTFLTDEQLAVMDETEGIGVAYERVVFDSEKVNISVGWAGPFWHYRSLQPPLLVNGEPVSFAALPAQHRKFHSESEAEILGLVARSLRVSTRRLFEASIADPAFRDSTEKEVLSGGLADDGHYFNSLHGTMSCDHMKARGSPYVVVVRDEVYGDLKRHLRPAYAVIRAKAPVTEPPQAVRRSI